MEKKSNKLLMGAALAGILFGTQAFANSSAGNKNHKDMDSHSKNKCGNMMKKSTENKCGSNKCGANKCGAEMKKKAKKVEKKTAKQNKCGANGCGANRCG